MASTAHAAPYISEQDYLEGEKVSEIRHEYVDGKIYAMAGSSKRHNRIAGNFYRLLMAGNSGCSVYLSDIKVHISERNSYYYPDLLVGCEPDDADDYYLEKPCLIVEVLSDSTARKDRTEKLLAYMNIPSLRVYLLVAQDKQQVEMFYREPEGKWWVQSFDEAEAVIELPCVDISVSLADLYQGVSATI
jgi:Uma2 family endonuclease